MALSAEVSDAGLDEGSKESVLHEDVLVSAEAQLLRFGPELLSQLLSSSSPSKRIRPAMETRFQEQSTIFLEPFLLPPGLDVQLWTRLKMVRASLRRLLEDMGHDVISPQQSRRANALQELYAMGVSRKGPRWLPLEDGTRRIVKALLVDPILFKNGPSTDVFRTWNAERWSGEETIPLHHDDRRVGVLTVATNFEGVKTPYDLFDEGISLQALMREVGFFLEGLGAMHEQGIVHGDIKPGQFLHWEGWSFLADFETAQMMKDRDTLMITTKDFNEINFFDGLVPVDAQRDIFAFGASLFVLWSRAALGGEDWTWKKFRTWFKPLVQSGAARVESNFRRCLPPSLDERALQAAYSCLSLDRSFRPTAAELWAVFAEADWDSQPTTAVEVNVDSLGAACTQVVPDREVTTEAVSDHGTVASTYLPEVELMA